MIKKNRLLSIITVVKNDNKRLKKTLDNLCNISNNKNFEHIIVENLEKKKNVLLSKKFIKDNNIRYINDENNENGIYNAMNDGINASNSSYTLFINAGDTLIIKQKELFKIIENINNNYSFADIIFLKSALSFNKKKIFLIPNINFTYKMPTSHQAMLFKTSFLKKNKFNLKYKVASDFDLVLKAKKNNLVYFDTIKHIIEIEYGGFSSKNYLRSYFEYFLVLYYNKSGNKRIKALILLFMKFVMVYLFNVFFKEETLFNIKRKINKWIQIKI